MDATLRVVLLGNDAIAAAAPATPVQLMHACRAAGFGLVVPPNWGDELVAMEALRQLDGLGRQPAVLVTCPHVAARVESVPGGPDLALVAIVSPPVAVARHLRRLAGDTKLHLTYVGGCPDAVRPECDINERLTPDEFLAALVDLDIEVAEQPVLFDDVLPPDRRRWVSLPGGVPMPAAVARRGGHSLVELEGVHAEAAVRWRSLVRGSGLVDVAAGLGCACSGALPGRGGSSARARIVESDPPRARSAVIAELPGMNLERRVTLQRATPRSSPPRAMAAVEEQQPPAPPVAVPQASAPPASASQASARQAPTPKPQREPDPPPPPRPDPEPEPEPEHPPAPAERAPEIEPPPVVPSEVEPPHVDPPSGAPPMRAAEAYVLYAPTPPVPEPVPAMTLLVEAERDAAFAHAAAGHVAGAFAGESTSPGDAVAASAYAAPAAEPAPAARPLLATPKAVLHTPVRVPVIGVARDVAREWLHRPLPRGVQLAVMAATIAGVALLARWTRPRAEGASATVPAASALMDSAAGVGSSSPATAREPSRPAPRVTPRPTPATPSLVPPARRTTRSAPGTVARAPVTRAPVTRAPATREPVTREPVTRTNAAPAAGERAATTPASSAPTEAAPVTPVVSAPAAAPRETTMARPTPRPAATDSASLEREAIRRELEQRRARLDSIQRRVDSLYRSRRPPR